ncbi:UNVERIFIED_CONTAM: Retrovirus-related Pol polyprotein from transposon RE1 [Sesamum radiatum]|uniref:Retrovirus-related Pol polyprotein from transposon RE1 n=1 Tax=Sesamum radiatum TaxID=300843 RepID=A0AAW2N9E9_SESRA
MFESGLPSHFWADSILTATYIINKLPSAKLNWKSPYELLYTTPRTYDNLKTFGCLCYASNILPHKSKFDKRAFQSVFIGYVRGQKGYKLFDMVNKNVLISRDVYEHIFPYHSSKPTEPDPIPIPNPIPSTIIPAPFDTAPISHIDQPINTNNVPIPAEPTTQPLNRPHIHVKPLAWLNDFYCNNASDPLHTSCSFSSSHNDFLAVLSTVQEPNNYIQAKGQVEWENAMQQEIAALEKNATWKVVNLPKDKKAIGSKWVYKIKLNPDGTIECYKARLVAKGYNQVEGVDYIDRFSPVAKAVTVRLFLAVAFSYAWPIHQVDINNAFLHGFLDEDIYMSAPDGYSVLEGKVCKLRHSLYGLKQASRQWNQEMTSKLIGYGFSQSVNDNCLFVRESVDGLIILLVYVDDVLIRGTSESQIVAVKQFFDSEFTIKDFGHAKYFLGLEIARLINGTSVSQYKYIRNIFQDAAYFLQTSSYSFAIGFKTFISEFTTSVGFEAIQKTSGTITLLKLHTT